MPRDTSDIGSTGLEQGGGNLGNDYSRRITTDRNEQNTTTNVGSSASPGENNDRSERMLDREEDPNSEEAIQEKVHHHSDRLSAASAEDSMRSDNQGPASKILDGDEGGSLPDPETASFSHDED